MTVKKPTSLFSVALPKWPGFLVTGKPVTPNQAAEIIIRTSDLYFGGNDDSFRKQLWDAAGVKTEQSDGNYLRCDWRSVDKAKARFQCLDLAQLTNHQVISSWVGGPHGWCHWDGTIGCDSYNIGKHPYYQEVLEDWQTIAKAFPFLSLRSQLLDGEISEDASQPVAEFVIERGEVTEVNPTVILCTPHSLQINTIIKRFIPGGEHGCTLDQFKAALETTEKALPKA